MVAHQHKWEPGSGARGECLNQTPGGIQVACAKQRKGSERAPIAAFVEVEVGCSPAKVELNVVRGVQLP